MVRQAPRVDTTAKALTAYAESLGFVVVTINGVIDCLLVFGSTIIVCDWKSQGATLTPSQARLVARGVPIRFISTPAQLDALRAEMSK